MTKNQVTVAEEKFRPYILAGDMEFLRSTMKDADSNCMDGLMAIEMKKKTVALLLSIFLGGIGAGRFYLGDKTIAIWRIVVTVLTGLASLVPVLGIIVSVGSMIWIIAEWFLCYKRAKKVNYERLSAYLYAHPAPIKKVFLEKNV